MSDQEILGRMLNSFEVDLKRMESALSCPACFKLLDKPIMLPCNHVFCSNCIASLTNDEFKCTSCDLPFLHEDLRPFQPIKKFLDIYKNMNSTVSVILQSLKSQALSGRDYVNVESEKNIPNIPKEHPSVLQLHESLSGDTNMEDSNNLATEQIKRIKSTSNKREEAFLDHELQPSPPSFVNIKVSHTSEQGTEQRRTGICSIRISRETDLQVGNKHMNVCDNSEVKRRKLNSEFDVGCKGGTNTRDFFPDSDPEHNKQSIPENQPLHTSSTPGSRILVNCMFCHSFRITEAYGQMQHYLNGMLVEADQATQPNVLHVHEKCVNWAPQVYFKDDIIMNLESELSRASKIKCSSCGKKGAALGCYSKSCRRSYHVPCAYDIQECRWDCENYLMLCPVHSSHKLPCDKSQSKSMNKTDHSSPDLPSPSDLPALKTQQCGKWTASASVRRNWVLCRSALSNEEKELLGKFGSLSGAHVTSQWKPDVTHVIASTDADGACNRTLKFLMAILTGKWVVGMKWIQDCMDHECPVEEEPYEITHDIHGSSSGPRRGRMRELNKEPPLFLGLCFCFDGYFRLSFKSQLEQLTIAGGGILLKRDEMIFLQESRSKVISPKALVVYNSEPPEEDNSTSPCKAVVKVSKEAAEALACKVGAKAIPHTWILDSIAACNMQPC